MKKYLTTATLAMILAIPAHAEWEYHQREDDLTDERYSWAKSPVAQGDPIRRTTINVRCREGNIDTFFIFDYLNLTHDEPHGVDLRYRFDSGEVEERRFTYSDSRQALFAKGGDWPYRLSSANILRVRYPYYRHGSVVVEYSLSESSKAIEKVLADCPPGEWEYEPDDGSLGNYWRNSYASSPKVVTRMGTATISIWCNISNIDSAESKKVRTSFYFDHLVRERGWPGLDSLNRVRLNIQFDGGIVEEAIFQKLDDSTGLTPVGSNWLERLSRSDILKVWYRLNGVPGDIEVTYPLGASSEAISKVLADCG